MTRFYVLLGLLAAANVGMGLHVVDLYTGATAPAEATRMLPPSIAIMHDATGEPVGPLAGKVAVLSFAREADDVALDIINRVSSVTDADSVRFILFSDSPSAVSDRIAGKSVVIVPSTQLEWMRRVNASSNLETWSVYDARGVQRARGDFSRGGLEGAIGKLLGTMPEYSATLLATRLRRHFAPDGSGFVDDIRSPTPAHAVLFVGRLMSGCPIANALQTTDDTAARADRASFSVLVPPDWLDQEIEAMKVNLSLDAPVRRAPAEVAATWSNLERIYGATTTAGFFVKFEPGEDPQVLTKAEPILRFLDADRP